MNKKTLNDIFPELKGRRVLVRVDFNVPIESGRVEDDTRIHAVRETIQTIREGQGRAVLISHLGRPKGQFKPEFSLRPVAEHLQVILNEPVLFAENCIGPEAERVVDSLENGEVCLLENLRFHPGEEQNDPAFAEELAALGDVYVNDAFGTAHRAHASTDAIKGYIDTRVAGLLMQKELDVLGHLLSTPRRPFIAVLGGAKVSGKLEVIASLMKTVDTFLIGGGMAFTFLKAQGHEIGRSLVEDDLLDTARSILDAAKGAGKRIVLPSDFLAAASLKEPGEPVTVNADAIPADLAGFDIGPRTIDLFKHELKQAGDIDSGKRGTVFWNGPMGVFERPPFDKGTNELAEAIAEATDAGAITVVGGGDSVAAVREAGVAARITHISTGGGASLKFLEGKTLPGVAALNDRE